MRVVCLFLLALVAFSLGDVYLHNPRGSNNRLNGEGTNVQNNARLCDTQNNNKGGYCWGPPMYYYVGSQLLNGPTNMPVITLRFTVILSSNTCVVRRSVMEPKPPPSPMMRTSTTPRFAPTLSLERTRRCSSMVCTRTTSTTKTARLVTETVVSSLRTKT